MVDVTAEQVQRDRLAIVEKQTGYRICFVNGAAAGVVLADLGRFCRAEESTFHPDPRQHAVLEGRREVWLRIQNYLNKTPEQLLEMLYGDTIRVMKVETDDA